MDNDELIFDTPEYNKKMKEVMGKIGQRREKYGFITCPNCDSMHTVKTLTCRECEYKAILHEESGEMTTVQLINKLTDEQGWNESSLMALYFSFIEEQMLLGDLLDYLQEQADIENDFAAEK
jgi:hypothetical protein